jgi:hypothetical protein
MAGLIEHDMIDDAAKFVGRITPEYSWLNFNYSRFNLDWLYFS